MCYEDFNRADNWYSLYYQSTEYGESPFCEDKSYCGQKYCGQKKDTVFIYNYNSTNDKITIWHNLSYQDPDMRKYY